MKVCCLPKELREALNGYEWRRQTIGESGAESFLLTQDGAPHLFLKAERNGRFRTLPHEAARLRWLADHGIACASVLALAEGDGWTCLVTSAIRGTDMASIAGTNPATIVRLAALALKRLHGLDIGSCPFDHRAARRIAQVRERVEAGRLDEDDFDEERRGRTARDLLLDLAMTRPAIEDLVVAHGDACLPNLMVDQGNFTGFVDCASLGVADRWQDLALACRSMERNLGDHWAKAFLTAYGVQPDGRKMAFFRLLDEFF